ncbi:MAG: tRNA (adenosine(37)-N6)-threonylcarbamoyltransferase complex ATPase subunit type 1 TsaE [Actinomycetota bacterium]|nr:tRNA (adenosine(37)-N6)-threonylcarbamoyltransferase complex ATPase subunit type 1 TsaE [Actinomycetota bacterium]
MTELQVRQAGPADLSAVLALIHTASPETPASVVAATLSDHRGLLAEVDGQPSGALLFRYNDDGLLVRAMSIDPKWEHLEVAAALVRCAEETAVASGCARVSLVAGSVQMATQSRWVRRGYHEVACDDSRTTLAKPLPVQLEVRTPEQTRLLGTRLARLLRAGDLVLLSGHLGAGKTTLTQGIGAGLGVHGAITSPTFVIARVHPAEGEGPALVHVDAYRLGGVDEIDDLDLDTSLEDSVTVVEWGRGVAESLAADRLVVEIDRRRGDAGGVTDDDLRRVRVTPVGRRWLGADLASLRSVGQH